MGHVSLPSHLRFAAQLGPSTFQRLAEDSLTERKIELASGTVPVHLKTAVPLS